MGLSPVLCVRIEKKSMTANIDEFYITVLSKICHEPLFCVSFTFVVYVRVYYCVTPPLLF